MPTPPLPIITPTSLTYRSIDGRVLPLTNLELDGNMSYLEKLAEERLPISDFTGQNIVNLINDTTGIGINAMYVSGYTASIEPVPLTVPVRDGNGIIYASAVTADTFYGKSTSSGDADTASKLKTAVAINGVNFDGSAPITIYDDSKLPLVGGVLSGKLTTAASTAASSGLLITPGSAPESPVNGDVWITSLGQFNRINGATKQVAYNDSNITGTAGNVSGVVAIANGGTGKKTADDARAALGAAKSGINNDITRLSGLTVAITATQGGTGLISAGDAGNVLTSDGTSWVSAPLPSNVNTASKLKTAVAINGVDFDGSAPITIYDDSKLSLDGDVLTGKLTTAASTAASSGLLITPGSAPESPVNGDVWITSLGQFNRINGATKQVAYNDSNITGTAGNVSGVVAIANGGTGKKTADDARAALGAAKSGVNDDIVRLSGLTVAITTAQGGTGLISAGDAGNVLTSDGTSWVSAPLPSNAVTATKLQTPRAINGVNFDGSAPITIYDDSKLPLVGGVLSGKLVTVDSKATGASISITPGSAPESPVNGDVWITSLGQFNRINGATKQVAYNDSNITGTAGNVSGVVAIANGGTGKKTAGDARAALGAAKSGVNDDITRLSGLTVAITPAQGGTGLTSAGDAGNVLMSDGTNWVSTLFPSNAATASKLKTAVAINGVNFDGSAPITIYDDSKLPLDGGVLTGKLTTAASTAASSGLLITPGSAPESPVNGDVWITSLGQFNRINGATKQVAYTNSDITGTADNVSGVVAIANGGTGKKTADDARAALGAAKSGINNDITRLSGLTTALSVSQGGTGLTSAGDAGNVLTSDGTIWVSAPPLQTISSASLVGAVVYFAMGAIDPGWLPCDGSAYPRTTYKKLFDKIGTTYGGAGEGSTTFNVPNLFDEFIRGVGANRAIGSWQNGYGAGLAEYQTARNPPGENNDNNARNVPSDGTWSAWNVTGRSMDWDDHHIRFKNYNVNEMHPRNVALLPCIFSGFTNSSIQFESFTIMPGADTVNEGSSISFNITGISSTNRSTLYWETESIVGGIIDFVNWNGTVNLTNSSGAFTITTISNIGTTDRSFRVKIYTDSNKTKLFSQTGTITIVDTTITISNFRLTYGTWSGRIFIQLTGKFPIGTVFYGTEKNGNGRFTVRANSNNDIGWDSSIYSYRTVTITQTFSSVLSGGVDLRTGGYTGDIVSSVNLVYSTDDSPVYPTCFPKNSNVLLYNGSWKPIQDITTDDILMGANGKPVNVYKMDTPLLGNRKMYQFFDGHTWSEEHAHWVFDNETQREWWWSANPQMWRNEVKSGAIGGLKNNDSIISHNNVKFAYLTGFVTRQIEQVDYPSDTQLYLPITDGTPIIVNGYVVGAGVNEFAFDYTQFQWIPTCIKE